MKKIDLVYLLTKSNWNEELRYSLRSFEKHFDNLGQVWIFGYLPPYIDRNQVRHQPVPPMNFPGVFVESIARRIVNDETAKLSSDYIFASDDNYVLRDVISEDFGPYWIEDLDQVANRGSGAWHQMLWRSYDLLKYMGHTGLNLESHTPNIVNRNQYGQVAKLFVNTENAAKHRYQSVCMTTCYWNIVGVEESQRRWAHEYRVGFTDNSCNSSEDSIRSRLVNRTFLFHDDSGLSDQLKNVIHELFPDRSRFEL